MKEETPLTGDAKLIKDLGGPSKVAELLSYSKKGGPQRVQNWITRGIPPKVKILRPDLFLKAENPDAASTSCMTEA